MIKYTKNQLEKQLALLEDHLLWMEYNVADTFCYSCIWGHIIKIEGYCEEWMKFEVKSDIPKIIVMKIEKIKEEIFSLNKKDYSFQASNVRALKLMVWGNINKVNEDKNKK